MMFYLNTTLFSPTLKMCKSFLHYLQPRNAPIVYNTSLKANVKMFPGTGCEFYCDGGLLGYRHRSYQRTAYSCNLESNAI